MEGNANTQPNELETLLASLGTDNESDPQPADDTNAGDATGDAAGADGAAGTTPAPDQTQAPAATTGANAESIEDLTAPDARSNKAFAQMRTQNKAYSTVLQQMLTRMGVDPTLAADPQRLQQMLAQADVKQQAQAMQVPAELLQRVVQLEQTNKAQEMQRIQQTALRGFKHVKDTYGLTDKEMSEFARQLQDAGTNPFEKEMDLDLAYRTHNLQKIIDKATQKAVQEALSNQEAASKRSTTPSKSTGKPESAKPGDDEINTMAQFDRMLMSI